MRRLNVRLLLASAAAAFLGLLPVAAAATGGPAGGFVIPAGSTASFSAITFGACNNLSWGYQLNGGANQVQATFAGGCTSGTAPDVTIGPFATPTSLRIFLTDNTCHVTYYSDGLPVDHVIVSGSNPYQLRYADAGGFCERPGPFNDFQGCNFCVTLAITDQAIAASGRDVSAIEGQSFSGAVATFSDADQSSAAADYSASINWGDGTPPTAGTISGSGGSFAVSGSHTYAEEGSYVITVVVTDVDNSSSTATAHGSATVADAKLTAVPACTGTSTVAYAGPTATFTDAASPSGTLSDFSATIAWGDGSTSAGTVSGGAGGPYTVSGSHTYGALGAHTITTSINDVGGSTATTSCSSLTFAFPGRGDFVVGDQSATGRVLFWGARWSEANRTSGGPAPRSFKGFEDSVATPTCGAAWSSDPGNSSRPPDAIPPYMAVIVASSVTKSGSSEAGNTVHMVVVKTDPGYASDPGHAGTGTVVAVIC